MLIKNDISFLQHLAVIMDGNGRWATKNQLPKIEGYKQGVKIAENIVKYCLKLKIKYITLYVFSTENWYRPLEEVASLIELLEFYLNRHVIELHEKNIKLNFIGNLNLLPEKIMNNMIRVQSLTGNNDGLYLNVAISYGARQEIVNAICNIVKNKITCISEEVIQNVLYTKDFPDVDFLIRTGGEKRLSNFLLWQLAYAELYFSDILWPDFNCDHFQVAIDEFLNRSRRYGR